MSFMENIQSAINEAAEHTDMNEARKGGGDGPRIPVAGLVRLRFISYIETGEHEDEWKGQKRKQKKITLQFELSGPKHPPLELDDGRKLPFVITVNEKVSLTEKSGFYKLFKRMNHTGEYKHMAQMLGKEFLGTVVLKEVGEGAEKRTYANLRDEGGYTIRPAYHEDLEGNSIKVEVQQPLTPLKCFIWDYASKEMWDSIFIDGQWDDRKDDKGNIIEAGKSKNYYQLTIKSALNFAGSPISNLLFEQAGDLDLGGAEQPDRSEADKQAGIEAKAGAAADPLEGVS